MPSSIRDRLRDLLGLFPAALASVGIVDRRMGKRLFDLAVPVMVTGSLRTLVRAVDFFMVSVALGSAAVASLEFGSQVRIVALGLGLSLSGGTISVVSRFHGAEESDRADLALKQSLWLTLVVSLPLVAVAWVWATPLMNVLTNDDRTIELGTSYLRLIMLSTPFHFWTVIGAQAFAGTGNTRTPMYIRATSLPTNTVVNALLIFGLGPFPRLGVAGAAIGTTVANVLQATLFSLAFLSGRYRIGLPIGGKQVDLGIVREIVRVALPLSGTRLARTFGQFPFLVILGSLGTGVVAAYAIGRRLMSLARTPSWGYATAASTLVGQSIGRDDEREATDFGRQSIRIALATQLPIGAFLIVAARPLALLFSAEDVSLTVTFIYVFGVGLIGASVGRTLQGVLRGAGDTRFPFYGSMLGNYLVKLPVAALALPVGFVVATPVVPFTPGMGVGLGAVYLAILGDMYARALVNWIRFRSGRWMAVGKAGAARLQT